MYCLSDLQLGSVTEENKRENKSILTYLIISWRKKLQFWKIIAWVYVCLKPELLTEYNIHVINLI